jgi:hypothetical protein
LVPRFTKVRRLPSQSGGAINLAQFLDHAEPENWLFRGVMQEVQPDQAGVEIAVGQRAIKT